MRLCLFRLSKTFSFERETIILSSLSAGASIFVIFAQSLDISFLVFYKGTATRVQNTRNCLVQNLIDFHPYSCTFRNLNLKASSDLEINIFYFRYFPRTGSAIMLQGTKMLVQLKFLKSLVLMCKTTFLLETARLNFASWYTSSPCRTFLISISNVKLFSLF